MSRRRFRPAATCRARSGDTDIFGRYRFWNAELSWNRSDFYDLFGPVKRSRKGYAAKLGYDWELYNDEPRKLDLFLDFAYFDQIDTLPNAQNVTTNFTRLTTGEARLQHTDNVKRSIGAVDDEKGIEWQLDYLGSRVNGQVIPQVRGGLDLGFALPLANSSIWLRSAGGFANGDRNSTVANFYIGGFGNNYVDDREVKRYRQFDSFPGFEIDEISAHRFARVLGELNLPPIRFRDVGTPSLYLSSARDRALRRRALRRTGGSVRRARLRPLACRSTCNFTAALRLPMVLSVGGYAEGFEDGDDHGGETLVSLKIM